MVSATDAVWCSRPFRDNRLAEVTHLYGHSELANLGNLVRGASAIPALAAEIIAAHNVALLPIVIALVERQTVSNILDRIALIDPSVSVMVSFTS